MTRQELKTLYVEASATARTKPSQTEESIWFSKLGHLDIADLQAAIDAHFDKSHWMPKESELRPLADQAKRSRVLQANARNTYVRWQCPEHPAVIVGAFVEPYDFKPRRCPKAVKASVSAEGPVICGAKMVEIFRENDFRTGHKSAESEAA